MSASIPKAFEDNSSASLSGARGELGRAFSTAAKQGERKTLSQLEPMRAHLAEDVSGNPIAPDVTPRQLLDLKRGFGNEFVHNWNPETMAGVKGTAGRTYHQLAKAFEDAVPEAAPLNRRIGALIPVAKRGESAELNAPTAQRAMHRIAAHTGALTGSVIGGEEGYRRHGLPGAAAGAVTGLILPELIASPEGEMAAARVFDSSMPKVVLRAATGATLGSQHEDDDEEKNNRGSKK